MSCYFRHIKDILADAGIEVTPQNRKQVDQAVHRAVGATYKECPETWKLLKQQIKGDEKRRQELISRLKSSL